MGAVYQAEDTRLAGRLTALKEIRFAADANEEERAEQRQQFQREASILARLDHPALPKVSDFFSEGSRDFLVMDYVPGYDLRLIIEQHIRQDRHIPENDLLTWAEQLAEALIFLHTQGILHRDIKPANIKLTPDERIKLVDFGLVKVLEADEESETITVVQGRGSLHYTPLEQYGDDTAHTDARSDIYSFGATLYHLATNKAPVEAKQRFLNPRSLADPCHLNAALSERTAQAILWAMAMHPDDRPTDVAQFRNALLKAEDPLPRRVQPGLRAASLGQSILVLYDPDLARGNVVLALLAMLLLIAAIIVTFFSPPL
ncbi:MAG: serine/threonine protein kinase [Anaerolineae bacterium]|nr:serine/threonine protein kinase [Anaerolineae bacterium]